MGQGLGAKARMRIWVLSECIHVGMGIGISYGRHWKDTSGVSGGHKGIPTGMKY